MIRIEAIDLEQWAVRLAARAELPRIVRRLILVSDGDLHGIDMPGGEGIQRRGWDGIVDFEGTDPWIPEGRSAWEIGAGGDPETKANEDFNKRSLNPQYIDPSATTFVFVTPRNWAGKRAWAHQKESAGLWKAVRAYDAQDLEQWIEQRPSVSVLVGDLIGKRTAGLCSVEDWWREFTFATDPPLTSDVIIAGRQHHAAEIERWLVGNDTVLEIESDSPAESIAFFVAIVSNRDSENDERTLAKSVIVDAGDAWRELLAHSKQLVVILASTDGAAAAHLISVGHRVLVPLGPTRAGNGLTLPRPTSEGLAAAMQSVGFSDAEAKSLVQKCGRSLIVLRRSLARSSSLAEPEWALPQNGAEILPALMAGGWDENFSGDQDVLTRFGGRAYKDIARSLQRWIHTPDPPLRRAPPVLRLTAAIDAWRLLARYLVSDDFNRYRSAVIEVLSEIDPSLDLPPGERWAASASGKHWTYSSWLRTGLAEGLAILGAHGRELRIDLTARPEDWVGGILRQLLRDSSGPKWASIQSLLPTLAEAAPEAFMDAIEIALENDESPLLFLFHEEDDGLFGRCYHSGLLWALEVLAWCPDFIARVGVALATLARLDPGGRWGNRTSRSLVDIFLGWRNHTDATIEQKIAALDHMYSVEPDVTWRLLVDLLPGQHGTTSGTYVPQWRNWAQNVDKPVAIREHRQYVTTLIDKIIVNLGTSGARHGDLLSELKAMPPDRQQIALALIDEFPEKCLVETDRALFWSALRELLHDHRSFADADWALHRDILERLARVYERLEPTDPIERYAWLFTDGWPHLPDGRDEDYQEYQSMIANARAQAIRQINNQIGITGVLALARRVTGANMVGSHAAEVITDYAEEESLIQAALGSHEAPVAEFGRAFAARRRDLFGPAWSERMLPRTNAQWSTEKSVDLFLSMPATLDTWMEVQKVGEAAAMLYWSKVSTFALDITGNDIAVAIRNLLEADRPDAALELIEFAKSPIGLPFDLVAQALTDLLEKTNSSGSSKNFQLPSLERIFSRMDACPDKDEQRIGQLEWAFLPALAHSTRGVRALHAILNRDPGFFAQLISWVIKAKNGAGRTEERLDEDMLRERARRVFDLLLSWKGLPGLNNNVIDEKVLQDWIAEARKLLSVSGHRDIGDERIGEVLASAPPHSDGVWPCLPVRHLIEQLRNRRIENGIRIGVVNARGATWRGRGGAQERCSEAQFREWSRQIATSSPRTSSVLARIADSYASVARLWDNDAERDELRW